MQLEAWECGKRLQIFSCLETLILYQASKIDFRRSTESGQTVQYTCVSANVKFGSVELRLRRPIQAKPFNIRAIQGLRKLGGPILGLGDRY